MVVSDLEESLRRLVRQRIAAGLLSGTQLALDTGFQQAHISNFLNRRRGLSVEGLDRLLKALGLSVADLVQIGAAPGAQTLRDYDDVPLVATSHADRPDVAAAGVVDVLKFKRAFLRRLRARGEERGGWRRFVLIKADAENALAMYPRVLPGATPLLDRHYTSLEPYRRREPNLYALRRGRELLVRYVEQQQNQLLLRPANPNARLASITMETGKSAGDYIVGRVCHIGTEA